MSEIVKVTDVTGLRDHKTLKGQSLSPVFYEAVKEYHDVLATGDFDAMFNFLVSEITANKVAENIRNIAIKLNDDVLPNSLDVLPLDLYNLFYGGQHNVILTVNLPLEGSKKRADYDRDFLGFRKTISKVIAQAYHLPISLVDDHEVVEKMLEFSGQTTEVASKSLKKIVTLRSMNVLGGYVGSVALICSTTFSLQYSILGSVIVVLSIVGLLPAFIFSDAINDSLPLKKGKTVSFAWGLYNKALQSTVSEYETLIKPSLASMESYLLQEGSAVEELVTGKAKETVILEKPGKPLSGLQKRIAEGKADPISAREREQLEEMRAIYRKRFGRDIEEALSYTN